MSSEMDKIRAGKERMRHKLASLPIEQKLRIVEQLREDGISHSPKEGQISDGDQKKPDPQARTLLGIIHDTVNGNPPNGEIKFEKSDRNNIAAEVEKIFSDRIFGSEALKALFPEGIPVSLAFYDRLKNLQIRLGWNELSHRVAGLFLLLSVEQLPADSGETLLQEMPKIANPYFFMALDSLSVLAAERELRAEFVAEWFPALVRRIGNDLASAGFWKALGIYCDRHPQNALEVLGCLSSAQSEEQISVAAFILGAMRCFDLNESLLSQFKKLELQFSNSETIGPRSVYNRSWIETSRRGKMRQTDLELLVSRMSAGMPDEREHVYWIVTRSLLSPLIPADCLNYGLSWLCSNVSGSIAPAAKYNVIDFAVQLPAARRKEAGELVLLVQPILAEHKGIWQRLEHFLVIWLQTDLIGFNDFILELANKNARNWLEILRTPRSFEWFLSELHGKDVGNLVGQLVLSPSANCRKLGLFFFDELGMSSLPATVLNTVSEEQVRVAFYELQRGIIHGDAIARYLTMLIPCVQRASSDFQAEFYDLLVLQLKNYPGACRGIFEKRRNEFAILNKAIDEVANYFKALEKVRKSCINAMEVAGYRRAEHLYSRRFSNVIAEGAEQASVFMQFIKKVQLLYGKTWSSFYGGKLGEASSLKQLSGSSEIPRLEIIDPEGMALRRLYASAKILELRESTQTEQEQE